MKKDENNNDKMDSYFDNQFPYKPQSERLYPICIDPEIEAASNFYGQLMEYSEPYIEELLDAHLQRVKTEWFYRLFYAYQESKMDDNLTELFNYICKIYPQILGKNKILRSLFDKLISTQDLLMKKYLVLVIVGNEPNIIEHVRNLTEKMLSENINNSSTNNANNIKKIIMKKTERLLVKLPNIVQEMTIKKYNRSNIKEIIINFLWDCMNLYEIGI